MSHSAVGGVRELWTDLASGFQALGYDVGLVALYPVEEDAPPGESSIPLHHIVPARPTGIVGVFRLMRALVRYLRTERPDFLLTALPAANAIFPLAARLAGRGTQVILSHHSPTDTHNRLFDQIDSLAGSLGNVRAVVSVSETVANSLGNKPKRYRAKRKTIGNALSPPIEGLLTELAARSVPRRARHRTVVATGRLAPQKNYPLLLRAIGRLPGVTLDIFGIGPDEADLAALAREVGAAERIHLFGHRPRAEALAHIARGDIFAQVSHFEGHSLGLIEAAKLGLPLIVSDVPVQIEGITAADGMRCGIVVGLEDDAGLAHEIARLLDEPDHYALWSGRAVRLGAEATYDRMVESYRRLVG